MLEGLASWILKSFLGKYVNVNQEKLSIGLLSGVVELENASLKLDALNESTSRWCPFEIKFGHIGKIKLNIYTYTTSPWSLIAENISIILGPPKLRPPASAAAQRAEHADKLDRLNRFENKWFKEVELLGIDADEDFGEFSTIIDQTKAKIFSYLAPFAYSLVNNLQVNLNGLHIRFEIFLYPASYNAVEKYLRLLFSLIYQDVKMDLRFTY